MSATRTKEEQHAYYIANRDRWREWHKKRRADPEKRAQDKITNDLWKARNKDKTRSYTRKFRAANKEHFQEQSRRAKYGISPEEYADRLNVQRGLCAICRGEQTKGRTLAVDHCHKTGRIRGLLCDRCNKGLGYFKDDVRRLREAALYLESFFAANPSGL